MGFGVGWVVWRSMSLRVQRYQGRQCGVFTDTAPRPNCREIAPVLPWPQSRSVCVTRANIE